MDPRTEATRVAIEALNVYITGNAELETLEHVAELQVEYGNTLTVGMLNLAMLLLHTSAKAQARPAPEILQEIALGLPE